METEINILSPDDISDFSELIDVFDEVFVQADRVDDYALDFYRSTKPTNEEDVIHFSYLL